MEKDYVVLIDRSAGNETVGEMWTEPRVFSEHATLKEVAEWVRSKCALLTKPDDYVIANNVRITSAQ